MAQRASDNEYMTGETIQIGSVASVDYADATCTVQLGDIETGPLHWITPRAGAVRIWSPPVVGEQCLILCPEGDLQNGIVLPAIFCDAFPAPATSANVTHIEFIDGARIIYDHVAHALTVSLPDGGTAVVDAPGGATINGPVTINGLLTVNDDVQISGTATAATDVVGGGKSLKGHKHGGVQAGGAQTGAPA